MNKFYFVCFIAIIPFLHSCKSLPVVNSDCKNPGGSAISAFDYRVNSYDSPVEWDTGGNPILVYIDSKFDTFESGVIQEAIDYWNQAVQGEVLSYIIIDMENSNSINQAIKIREQEISRDCGFQALGVATTYFYTELFTRNLLGIKNSVIEIYDRHDHDETYLRTIVHEIGHALGLMHDAERNSVMYPIVLTSPWMIYEEDIQFVSRILS